MDLVQLGSFLKSRRDRIQPSQVGLDMGTRRRVPGLRRDEVARLAGASTDYYAELEQGRGARPSEEMLAAISRALRMSKDERDHIFNLAGRVLPTGASAAVHIHPGMLDLIDRLEGTPARLISDLHVTLIQNPLARSLLGPATNDGGLADSFIYRWFTDADAREIYPREDHDHHSVVNVADLRAVHGRRGQDPDVRDLVETLLEHSDEFTELWSQQTVALRHNDCKRIVHPTIGTIEVNCLSLHSENGSQRLLWFTPPPGTDAVEQFELLSVIGTQALHPD